MNRLATLTAFPAAYVLLLLLLDPSSDISMLITYAATLFMLLFGLLSFFSSVGSRAKKPLYTAALYLGFSALGFVYTKAKQQPLHKTARVISLSGEALYG
jgi:hypothetical protein